MSSWVKALNYRPSVSLSHVNKCHSGYYYYYKGIFHGYLLGVT